MFVEVQVLLFVDDAISVAVDEPPEAIEKLTNKIDAAFASTPQLGAMGQTSNFQTKGQKGFAGKPTTAPPWAKGGKGGKDNAC